MKTGNFISADFETHQPNKKGGVGIYLWGARSTFQNTAYVKGVGLDDFYKYLSKFKGTFTVFFHNGGKFDYHYLLDMFFVKDENDKFIFNQKFTASSKVLAVKEKSKFKEKYKKSTLLKKGEFLKYRDFTILTDENKKIIEIKIGKKDTNEKGKNHTIIFRDSFQLFKGSIAQYGKMLEIPKLVNFKGFLDINKSYNSLKDFEKKVLNYKKHYKYLKRDVDILHNFLLEMEKILPFNKWKATIASTAYSHFLNMSFCMHKNDGRKTPIPGKLWVLYKKIYGINISSWYMDKKGGKFWKFKLPRHRKYHNSTKLSKIIFNDLFPVNWLNQKDELGYVYESVRESYRGGITYVNPSHQGLLLEKRDITHIDINSSYPSQMMEAQLPIGESYLGKNVKKGAFKILKIECVKETSNYKALPILQTVTNAHRVYPQKIIKGDIFDITTPEWELVKKYYGKKNFKVKIMHSFDTIKGSEIFGDYINYFWEMKIKAKKEKNVIMEYFSKLMLNSLYGKFGEKNERTSKIFNSFGDPDIPYFENETLILKAKKYWPLSIAITAYARCKLINAVGNNFKDFHYADTDSLIVSNLKKFDISISKKLGDWSVESDHINKFIARTPKQYGYSTSKKTNFVFAGVNDKSNSEKIEFHMGEKIICGKLSFDILTKGGYIGSQIRPKRNIVGGVLLEEYVKEIHPPWKIEYGYNPENWFYVEPSKPKKYQKELKEKYKKNYTKQLGIVYKSLDC